MHTDNPHGVKAILFDTFGTVVNWRGSLIGELSAWGATRGLNVDWTGLVDAWRGAYAPSMDRVRRGELPWTILDDLHRATLDQLVVRFGVTGLSEADLDFINRGGHRLRPWPDAVPGQVMMAAAHNGDLRAARALGLKTCFFPRDHRDESVAAARDDAAHVADAAQERRVMHADDGRLVRRRRQRRVEPAEPLRTRLAVRGCIDTASRSARRSLCAAMRSTSTAHVCGCSV